MEVKPGRPLRGQLPAFNDQVYLRLHLEFHELPPELAPLFRGVAVGRPNAVEELVRRFQAGFPHPWS